ncbi:MAG: SipW-dependent-type signal peptide-containing protein [Vagococcus sp.]
MSKKCKHTYFVRKKRMLKRRLRRFKKQHSKLGIVVLLFTILAIGSASTFAWFTASDSKNNEFRTDFKYRVELVEEFTTPKEFTPNEPVQKKVSAKNTGNIPSFVRILLFPEIFNGDSIQPVDTSEVSVKYRFGDESKWQYGEDGYYYYLEKLMPGEETELLINEVTLNWIDNNNLRDKYKECHFNVAVKLESVDVRNNEYRFSWWNDRDASPNQSSLSDIDTILQTKMR